ncbi:MAG: VOC family protein [Dehalococcoidia bacterium]|jgi:catechol 2,3-dioxygenase-like lactoylglutathione lyase family enzyme
MKNICTLIAVRNMDKSKQFYHDVLGLDVTSDFGANAVLTDGIALQTVDTWKEIIHKQDEEITFKNNACELYFEEDDIDAFAARLKSIKNIEYVHPLFEQPWGQRVVRFYDPDKHLIEVGENMNQVVRRFIDSGLSIEDTAARMDVPVDYVSSCLA